jgi:1,4-dihydroxy-2-naphthoyl-CoA hydrolase
MSRSRGRGRVASVTGANLAPVTNSPSGGPDPRRGSPPSDPFAGTLIERLGIAILDLSADRTVGTMPVEGNTQPHGLLHGGASVALAETLGSLAATCHAGPGRTAVGIEIGASHHRPATSGLVTGTATLLHLGRRTASYEIVVEDAVFRRICTARLTCMLVDSPVN